MPLPDKTWIDGQTVITAADMTAIWDTINDLEARVVSLESSGGGGSPTPTFPKGDGYVGAIADQSPYSEMRVTAVDDAYEMIGFDITHTGGGRTRILRLQGPWISGTPQTDGYQRIEEVFLGSYLAVPRSNMEFAFQLYPSTTATSGAQFVPYHGTVTAVAARPVIYRDLDGNVLDLNGLAYGASIVPNGLVVDQSVYARHPDTGTTNHIRIDSVTTFYPDGMIEVQCRWEALIDVKLGSVYAPMIPYQQADMTTLQHSGGTVTLDTAPVTANTNQDLPDTITSGLLSASSRPGVQIAWAWTDPNATLRWAEPDRKTSGVKTFVQRRPDAINKIYAHAFNTGVVVTAGTVWNFGAQWRIQEST